MALPKDWVDVSDGVNVIYFRPGNGIRGSSYHLKQVDGKWTLLWPNFRHDFANILNCMNAVHEAYGKIDDGEYSLIDRLQAFFRHILDSKRAGEININDRLYLAILGLAEKSVGIAPDDDVSESWPRVLYLIKSLEENLDGAFARKKSAE